MLCRANEGLDMKNRQPREVFARMMCLGLDYDTMTHEPIKREAEKRADEMIDSLERHGFIIVRK